MKQYEPFEGKIARKLSESTPWWPTPKHPGADAPNVVVFLIDDLGFSHFNCFSLVAITTPLECAEFQTGVQVFQVCVVKFQSTLAPWLK